MRSRDSLWGTRLQFWGPPILAAFILTLMLIPAEYWRHPIDDAAYQGFDPNLIYVDRKGGAPSSGLVEVTSEELTLTALPNSRPTATLVTTPLRKLELEMDVQILAGGKGTVPFRVGVWSPNTKSGQFLQFGPPPSNLVTLDRVVDGIAGPTLVPGRISNSEILGSYVEGVSYRTKISIDRGAGRMHFRVVGGESPPTGHRMLRMTGRGHPVYPSHALSDWVEVKGGEFYYFGGFAKHVRGSGTYGFVVEWINRYRARVGTSEEWHDVAELDDWAPRRFEAIAPPDATSARLIVGTARGVEVLFADLFLSLSSHLKDNILLNGDFSDGKRGWKLDTSEPVPPEIFDAPQVGYAATVNSADAVELFREVRLAITASGFSESDISSAMISNYRLSIPHQRWLAVKVEDSRVTVILAMLLVCATLLSAMAFSAFVNTEIWNRYHKPRLALEKLSTFVGSHFANILFIAIAIGLYAVFNATLFNAGSLNYDLKTATVWLYVIPRYGLSALYHLPTVVGPADSWGGVPFQEAAFPYGPIMASIFSVVSWFHKLLFGLPEPFLQDSFALAFTVKATNLLFTIADAGLIFLILRAFRVGPRRSLVGAGMFLLNPAVIFVGSVWGQTQSLSLFFILASIWFGAVNRPSGAWVALALGALTRQQLIIPAFLLGTYFAKRFNVRQNVEGMSWGVLISFILTAPLALMLAPSLPVDLFRAAFDVHVVGEDSARSTLVSWSALSVWPLVTQWAAGQADLGRIFYSSKEPLIGNVTYWHVGNVLFLAVLLMSILAIMLIKRTDRSSKHIPILALGTLGLFLLKTGFAAFHLIPALALVIIGGSIFGRAAHYLAVTGLTLTTFVAMYGVAGVWMTTHPWWNVGLFSPEHPVTQVFIRLLTSDWFITMASLSNLAVLGWLAVVVVRFSVGRPSTLTR